MTQIGVSPKVVAAAVTGLVVFLLTKLAIPIDAQLEQAVNVLAMIAAGYLAPAGAVDAGQVGEASDSLLSEQARDRILE